MRRLFHQTKLYDYSSIKEAEKHMKEMAEKGWGAHIANEDAWDSSRYIYNNGGDTYPYSVEYFKEP